MTTTPTSTGANRLSGQTVVILGGSSGIGLALAHDVRAQGGDVILTGRDQERLARAAEATGAYATAAFDATDDAELARFFSTLDRKIDHVFVAAGSPYYAPLAELDLARARASFSGSLMLMVGVALAAPPQMTTGGSLTFMSGTGARRPGPGLTLISASIAAISAAAANLALEVAPTRVNVIAAGFVDTPLSARLLGEGLDARRQQLADELPVRRVVQAEDVSQLAVQVMLTTAMTGAILDLDGGQKLVS